MNLYIIKYYSPISWCENDIYEKTIYALNEIDAINKFKTFKESFRRVLKSDINRVRIKEVIQI